MTARKKIAYVQAAWHTEITDACKQAFIDELARRDFDVAAVDFFSAPGSHFHEHAVHQDFFRGHMATKGRELAAACLAIVDDLAAVA
jgi:6,7-dimethyl-8-ribityllumazine synthase